MRHIIIYADFNQATDGQTDMKHHKDEQLCFSYSTPMPNTIFIQLGAIRDNVLTYFANTRTCEDRPRFRRLYVISPLMPPYDPATRSWD